jgi:hypothetical protein
MAEGETLIGKANQGKLVGKYTLGSTSDRDLLPTWVIDNLIEEGLAKAEKQGDQIKIVLTPQTNLWYEKRGIRHRQAEQVTA